MAKTALPTAIRFRARPRGCPERRPVVASSITRPSAPARWDQAQRAHSLRPDGPGGAGAAGNPPSRRTPSDPGGDGLLRGRAQATTSTATTATTIRPSHPTSNVRASVARSSDGYHHGDPAGPISGTCRLDGQDDRSRGSGGEQQDSQYPEGHRACALGLAFAAEERENDAHSPPEWRRCHGDPRPEGQPFGMRKPVLGDGHAGLRRQVREQVRTITLGWSAVALACASSVAARWPAVAAARSWPGGCGGWWR